MQTLISVVPSRRTAGAEPRADYFTASALRLYGFAFVEDLLVERTVFGRVHNVNLIVRFVSHLEETDCSRVFPGVCGDLVADDVSSLQHLADWELRFAERSRDERLFAQFSAEHLIYSATSSTAPIYGHLRLMSEACLYRLGFLAPHFTAEDGL